MNASHLCAVGTIQLQHFLLHTENKAELQTTVQNAIKMEALWRAAAIAVTAKDVLFLPQFLFTNHN